MSKKIKIESLEEFLARGKTITKIPSAIKDAPVNVFKTASAGAPAIIMSLEEADLFYGEARKGSKPKKPKTSSKIDLDALLDALPEALRSKFITRMKEEHNGENFEEDASEETTGSKG